MQWIVEFGSLQKRLDDIHADTGIPQLAEPLKMRFARHAHHFAEVTIILKIDPARGLVYALRGSRDAVSRAQAALNL